MTCASLERLVEEATPGPWRPRDDGTISANKEHDTLASNGIDPGAVFKRPDATLIALAPDLARIVIEQHRALREIDKHPLYAGHPFQVIARTALALLDGLGEA